MEEGEEEVMSIPSIPAQFDPTQRETESVYS